ncbi:immunoglobulin superfamily member 1-like [Hemicordylus capensis]|uniref:immunoglobulin superfamily member 1-like n=1 Tax=Hemicordylus capensis TaxID=884348 RepID=UPI002303BEC5|nr:immunoglobulin superfamily member 1-like [Hemicordylus capensis]
MDEHDKIPPLTLQPDGNVTTFTIHHVGREHGGRYYCSYRPQARSFTSSEPSNTVELLVLDLDLPRPSISFYPSTIALLGSRVTIQCQASGPRKIFYFEKAGNQRVQQFETVGDSGTLFFQNVTRDHGGKYSCSYRYPPESIISRTSDNVELLVRDPSFSRPTISLSSSGRPARGRTVILHCQSQSPANRFYLHKSEDHMAEMFIETNGTEASFPISIGNWGHGGNYSCSYCPELESFVISEPSDSVELLITDPALLRPSISLEPRGIALLGSTVTIWCQTRSRRKIFYLEQAGGQRIQQYESQGDRGRFVFRNVTQEQTGYYSCSYRYLALFFIISGTSDNVELLGLDPKLPRPVISINHSGLVAAGGQVNIRCKIQDGSAKFYLHKGGDSKTKEPMRSDANVGEVSISNINQKHQGSYSCSYTFLERPFVFSLHSDSVELRIAEDTQNSVPLSTKLCVAVLILFLSLGAILWYKRNKGQLAAAKSSAKRSFRLLKACWVTDPDRNLIDGGNHMENLSPEPDPPAETQYICYFELEHRAVSSPVEADPADSSENCV